MSRGPSSFNFVSITIYLLLLVGCYASYKYIPIIWQRGHLEEMIKEASYRANRNDLDQVKNALVETAEREEGIHILVDDIEIEKFSDRVRIRVTWRPVVEFIGGHIIQHKFVIKQETTFYN